LNIITKYYEDEIWVDDAESDEEGCARASICDRKRLTKEDHFIFSNRLMGNLLRSRLVRSQTTRLMAAINTARITRAFKKARSAVTSNKTVTRLNVYLHAGKRSLVCLFLHRLFTTGLFFLQRNSMKFPLAFHTGKTSSCNRGKRIVLLQVEG